MFRFVFVLFILCQVTFAKVTDGSCKVRAVLGTAEFQKSASGYWKPLRVGTKLGPKDFLRTSVESQMELEFSNGSSVTIEENSMVEMAVLLEDGAIHNTKVDLKSGRLLFKIKKLNQTSSTFEFKMGNATAAIRGTEGGVLRTPKGFGAFLQEGRLEILSGGTTTSIGPGQLLMGNDGGSPVQLDLNAIIRKIRSLNDSSAVNAAIAEARKTLALTVPETDPSYAALSLILDDLLSSMLAQLRKGGNVAAVAPKGFSVTFASSSPLPVCTGAAQIQGNFVSEAGSSLVLRLGKQSSPDLARDAVNGNFSYTFNISDKAQNWDVDNVEAVLSGPQGEVSARLALAVDKKCPAVNQLPPELLVNFADSSRCLYRLTVGNATGDRIKLSTRVDGSSVLEEELNQDIHSQQRMLTEGIHDYQFVAQDLAGATREQTLRQVGCFKARALNVRIEGKSIEKIRLPPPPPGNNSMGVARPLRFTIDLPAGYDYRFIKRILVRKKGGATLVQWEGSNLQPELYYSIMVDLDAGIQTFEIEVEPRVGRTKIISKTFELL